MCGAGVYAGVFSYMILAPRIIIIIILAPLMIFAPLGNIFAPPIIIFAQPAIIFAPPMVILAPAVIIFAEDLTRFGQAERSHKQASGVSLTRREAIVIVRVRLLCRAPARP